MKSLLMLGLSKIRRMTTVSASSQYSLKPLPVVGAEVRGIDLKNEVPEEVVERIKEDVTKHRLLIFKDQGIISGDRQVEISQWFGELESTFYKHPASPHPDVFRVSNDRSQGCSNVGRTGWHIDGSFQPAPFSYSIYHIINVPKIGETVFAPLTEIVESLSQEERQRWERLYMVSDRREKRAKPLLYAHPVSGQPTLCFHLGMTDAFVYDYGTPQQRVTGREETAALLEEMESKFTKDCAHLIYSHHWEQGDFIISDNAALGHEASPTTQDLSNGLRVMHRTTIKGTVPPRKKNGRGQVGGGQIV